MKWEYYSTPKWGIKSEEEFLSEINELGKEGWELVIVTSETEESNPVAFFKRLLSK